MRVVRTRGRSVVGRPAGGASSSAQLVHATPRAPRRNSGTQLAIMAMRPSPRAYPLIPGKHVGTGSRHHERDVRPIVNVHGGVQNLSPVAKPDRAADFAGQLATWRLRRPERRTSEARWTDPSGAHLRPPRSRRRGERDLPEHDRHDEEADRRCCAAGDSAPARRAKQRVARSPEPDRGAPQRGSRRARSGLRAFSSSSFRRSGSGRAD